MVDERNHKLTGVFLTQHGSTIVVEKHVGGQRSLHFVSVDVLHWGFLFIFALFTLLSFFGFGGFYFRCSKSS
jgi:hypothetical protein